MANINLSELPPQAELTAELLINLIGELAQLRVMLVELSENEIKLLSVRIATVLEAVQALPIRIESKEWAKIGEA
jgi:hypothetical protein